MPKPKRTKKNTGAVPESGLELSNAEAACGLVSSADLTKTNNVDIQPLADLDARGLFRPAYVNVGVAIVGVASVGVASVGVASAGVASVVVPSVDITAVEYTSEIEGSDQNLEPDAYQMTTWLVLIGTLFLAVLCKNSSRKK
jgi:hypothetical protein